MPEEASMSFKVYLDLGGGRQEVRRFGLPETVATNYSVLREKICNIFGLSNQDTVLSWKDAEGDSITISTDDELMEAVADSVSNHNAQLVRINVVESSSSTPAAPGPSGPQGNQQGDVHPLVTCDSCNGKVQGFRYKCVTCKDFDLCGTCETKGQHKEHKMMRISKPQDAGGPWFFWKEKEDAPGHYSTHFGMHNKDGGGGFSSSASFSGCGGGAGGVGGGGGGGGGGGWGAFVGPQGRPCFRRGHHGGKGRGNWPGWWGRGWNGKNWNGCGQGQTMNSDCGSQQQQQQSSANQSPQQQSQQSQQQQSQQPQQQQSQQSQQQQSSGGCQREENCPWLSSESTACPFSGEESEMPTPEQVAEEAKRMAEQMAQQAAQHAAQHFASHYASDQLANVMRGIWTAWSGQQGQNPTTSSSSSSSSSHTHSHSHSASTSKDGPEKDASVEQDKSKDAGQSKEAARSAGEEYLRSVGETVAHILDPLGIDVEVDVEHNGIRQRCSLGENVAQSNSPPATPATPAREPDSSASSVVSGGSVNMEVQTECPSGLQAMNKGMEAMDVASPAQPESIPKGGEPSEGNSGSPDPEDWMLVNQYSSTEASAPSDPKPQTSPAEKNVSYPSLAELTPHSDPKIQRALEHMSAMGYSNDGGWLTNLLEMKQGDINQVLDLLQPVNK